MAGLHFLDLSPLGAPTNATASAQFPIGRCPNQLAANPCRYLSFLLRLVARLGPHRAEHVAHI